MRIIDLKKYSQLGLSFEENKNLIMKNYNSLFFSFEANSKISSERNIITEISLSRHASSYALLGAKFIPSNNNNLSVEIRYSENEKLYKESLSIHQGFTFIGLPKEFAISVEKSIIDYFHKDSSIPSGNLIISMAANCAAGSSTKIFSCLTKILLEILFHCDSNILDEQVIEITRRSLKLEFNSK